MSILSYLFSYFTFERKVKKVKENEVGHEFIFLWIEQFENATVPKIPHEVMLSTQLKMLNTCEGLLDGAYQTALKVSANADHKRVCPTSIVLYSVYEWFITDKDLAVNTSDYFKMLTRQVKIIATELKKMKDENSPDYEYHVLRSKDIFVDYHKLAQLFYKLK